MKKILLTLLCLVSILVMHAATGYKLVTSVDELKAGSKYIIASSEYALSTNQKSNNRGAVAITITGGVISTIPNDAQIITLEGETDSWSFNTGSGYLYAASSSSNYLKTQTTLNDNGKATISIENGTGVATIKFNGSNTRNWLRFNPNTNNGSPLFSCYKSGQEDVYLYVETELSGTSAPDFSIASGTYYETLSVELSCATEDATIYYTIDGNEPNANSTIYTEAIQVATTTTIKAIAIKGDEASNVVTATYTIVEPVNFGYVTKVTSGKKYLIVAERWITPDSGDSYISSVMATPLSGNYGYIDVEDATQENGYIKLTSYVNAFTITETEGGYTIQDSNGKYMYQTGTYNNFNVSTELPETGAVWTIVPTNDNTGSMTITNTSVNKWIQYSTGYSSFGSYDSLQTGAVLPRLYEEGATAEDDVLTGIEEAMIDADAPVEYYNLQGVKVANPENGIFIKRQGGKAIKVVL